MNFLKILDRIREGLGGGYKVYKSSCYEREGTKFALVRSPGYEKKLYVKGEAADDFTGDEEPDGSKFCPVSWENAQELMGKFAWLKPSLPPAIPSFGCGDRIGLATPGHVGAVEGLDVFPMLAQQSIREMERTGRSPKDVMNTAVWGVFEKGYEDGFAADADHLKSKKAVENTAKYGFNMFTCDPSEHVNDQADQMTTAELKREFSSIQDGEELLDKYGDREFTASLPDSDYEFTGVFDRESVMKAAIKYYRAVKFAEDMYGWVQDAVDGEFIFEVSVDETETPTSPLEHIFIAKEINDSGVDLFSLAPRFVGNIQKGIDYIGDLDQFSNQLNAHGAIANSFGNYRLSLHSGSDKFSIYPYFAEQLSEKIHVKTAGTSYLEALRLVAEVAPDIFREIYAFSLSRFDEDRATYHVETDLDKVPSPNEVPEEDLPGLLDKDDPRQVLHVAYGSVLTYNEDGEFTFKRRINEVLVRNEERHYQLLEDHIRHHVELLIGR